MLKNIQECINIIGNEIIQLFTALLFVYWFKSLLYLSISLYGNNVFNNKYTPGAGLFNNKYTSGADVFNNKYTSGADVFNNKYTSGADLEYVTYDRGRTRIFTE